MMKIQVTLFKNKYDNKTDKIAIFSSFSEFQDSLINFATKVEFSKKEESFLMSPASYVEGTTRANKNVVDWCGWAAIDVDDHMLNSESLEESLKVKYGTYHYVCYSTASSKKEKPKFRLVFPLLDYVPNEKIKHFWYALNKEFDELADAQTKDLSRMYYMPGLYKGSYNFYFVNKGLYINPTFLMNKHEHKQVVKSQNFLDNLPEEVVKSVIENRKRQLKNKEKFSWSSWHDCPFVNKHLVNKYMSLSNTGWYHKFYQIMVSIAGNAIKAGYPITAFEISQLMREMDYETGSWYVNRPTETEANRAIEYCYRNM